MTPPAATHPDEHALYDQRQQALWLRLLLCGLAVSVGVLLALMPGGTLGMVVGAVGGVLLLTVSWIFGSLRVRVSRATIRVAFGPGWPRRRLATAEVTAADVVRNRWWWGFGIRLTPTGWMWNLSGLDAVLVTHAAGRRLRIGTADPHGLAAAIRKAAGLPLPTAAAREP